MFLRNISLMLFDPFSEGNFKEIDSLIPENSKAKIGNTQCYG